MTDETVDRVIVEIPPGHDGPASNRFDEVREVEGIDSPRVRRETVMKFPSKPLGRDKVDDETRQAFEDALAAADHATALAIIWEVLTGDEVGPLDTV